MDMSLSKLQEIVKDKEVWHLAVHRVTKESDGLLCPWDSSGKNTGVGYHFLLQGISPTQGLNLGLLHCRQIIFTVWATRETLYIHTYIHTYIYTPQGLCNKCWPWGFHYKLRNCYLERKKENNFLKDWTAKQRIWCSHRRTGEAKSLDSVAKEREQLVSMQDTQSVLWTVYRLWLH